jgi:pre-mRNA-splicing factor CDC5/CEF1
MGGSEEQQQLMVMSEKRRQKALRAQLAEGLRRLPEAQYTYEISVPTMEEEEDGGTDVGKEEDAADRDARMAAKKVAAEEAELARRSTVLKRGLPRPRIVDPDMFASRVRAATAEADEIAAADAMVQQELLAVLRAEAAKYPAKEAGGKGKGRSSKGTDGDRGVLPVMPPQMLSTARDLVAEEAAKLRKAVDSFGGEGGGEESGKGEGAGVDSQGDMCPVALERDWLKGYNDLAYFPGRQAFGRLTGASKQDRLTAVVHEFNTLAGHVEKVGKKASKLDARLNLATGGYVKRATALLHGVSEALDQIDEMRLEVRCFRRLKAMEEKALVTRVAEVNAQADSVAKREEQLQLSYVELLDERDRLFGVLHGHEGEEDRGEEHNGLNGKVTVAEE